MLRTEHVEEYLCEVRAFAKKIGKAEQLEAQLQYLANYANHTENHKTECVLGKDFAPYSFSFAMRRRARSYSLHVHECDTCKKDLKTEESYHEKKCFMWDDSKKAECGGTLRVVGMEHHTTEGGHLFSGGLIFHGPHDGGGNGGAPTFSCSLVPVDGWSVHT